MNNTEILKVNDRVEVLGLDGKWYPGTLININFYREFPYCVDLDIDVGDYVFIPRSAIRKLGE